MLSVVTITIHVMQVVVAMIVLFVVLLVRIGRRIEPERRTRRPPARPTRAA